MKIILGCMFLCWSAFPQAAAMSAPELKALIYALPSAHERRSNPFDCVNQDFEAQCSSSPTDCVAAMCEACQGIAAIAECCSLASLAAQLTCCLNAVANPAVLSMTTNVTSSITSSAMTATISIEPVVGLRACQEVFTSREACQNETKGFAPAPFSQQAACLCFQSGIFNATAYDVPLSICLAYASTGTFALYTSLVSQWGSHQAPCSRAGSYQNLTTALASGISYIGYTTGVQEAVTAAASSQPSATMVTAAATASSIANFAPELRLVSRDPKPRQALGLMSWQSFAAPVLVALSYLV